MGPEETWEVGFLSIFFFFTQNIYLFFFYYYYYIATIFWNSDLIVLIFLLFPALEMAEYKQEPENSGLSFIGLMW